MDDRDKKILKALQGNARMSFQELGELLGISRVAAAKRVKRLEEAGVICGYNTCIFREGEVRAFIDVETEPEHFEELLEYAVTRTEYVRQIFRLFNQNHFLMTVVTPSGGDLKYLANVLSKQKGVVKVSCDAVAEIVKDVYAGIRKYADSNSRDPVRK